MTLDEPLSSPSQHPDAGIWNWDFSKDAMVWNDAMHCLFGMQPGTFGGTSDDFLKRIHNGDRAHVANSMTVAMASGIKYEGEFRVVWDDGSVHNVLMRGTTQRDERGKLCGMSGTCHASPNENSPGLTASMERTMFAALMDNLPDRIYFKDMHSRLIAVNEAMVKWHGAKDRNALLGKTDSDLFLDEHAKQALADEHEILESGQPLVNIEEKELWADGHVTYVSTSKMPLRDERGKIIGTFGVTWDITERKTSEEQLAQVAEDLRRKNEALQEDMAMARELQIAMLPQSFPAYMHQGREAARFFHFYLPSTTVSGDFFSVYEMPPDKVGVFICDVMGHGVRASLVATTARALVEEMTSKGASPEVLLADLNKALRRILKRTHSPLFVSACFLVADVSKREIIYANAGHPRPILVRNGAAASIEGKTGPVLGLFDQAVYARTVCPYSPHDTLLFFTDGLFEAENAQGELFDYTRLLKTVETRASLRMQELCREMVEEVERFSPGRDFNDDVCLVGMELL